MLEDALEVMVSDGLSLLEVKLLGAVLKFVTNVLDGGYEELAIDELGGGELAVDEPADDSLLLDSMDVRLLVDRAPAGEARVGVVLPDEELLVDN